MSQKHLSPSVWQLTRDKHSHNQQRHLIYKDSLITINCDLLLFMRPYFICYDLYRSGCLLQKSVLILSKTDDRSSFVFTLFSSYTTTIIIQSVLSLLRSTDNHSAISSFTRDLYMSMSWNRKTYPNVIIIYSNKIPYYTTNQFWLTSMFWPPFVRNCICSPDGRANRLSHMRLSL